MKKFIRAVLTALFLCLALTAKPASAMDRIQWWFGMNPPSSWMNYVERYTRLGFGQFIFDAVARSTNSFYSNLSVQTSSGLNVVVGPVSANTVGSLYQYLADDATSFGGPGGTALSADPSQIYLQGLMYAASSTIGPLTAGTSAGQSIDNLLECKVLTSDQTSQSVTFVSALGVVTSSAMNRDRADTIFCQNKVGVSAATGSQVVPTVDAGYVAIGYVAIANGVSTITGGMINAVLTSQFGGFLQYNGSGIAGTNGIAASGSGYTASPGDFTVARSATSGDISFGNGTTAQTASIALSAGQLAFSAQNSGSPSNNAFLNANGSFTIAPLINSTNTSGYVPPVYLANGSITAATMHIVKDQVTAVGSSTTVNLSGASVFANAANFSILVWDQATPGVLAAVTASATNSFTFTSTNTHTYSFLLIGF